MQPLPDFLIIGAQRCGTTYLYHLLGQVPDIYLPEQKELHFFDLRDNRPLAQSLFEEPTLHSHHLGKIDLQGYSSRFAHAKPSQLVGEATPCYMAFPWCAELIRQVIPKALKLVVLLRDPVDRAYSHYLYELGRGHEHLRFEDAIDQEATRTSDDCYLYRRFSYAARGQYADLLEPFSEHFGPSAIKLIPSTQLYSDPAGATTEVLSFLGVPNGAPLDLARPRNRSRPPMFPTIHRLARRLELLLWERKVLWRLEMLSKCIRRRLPRARSISGLDSTAKMQLLERFHDSNRRLKKQWGFASPWL